MGLSIRGINPQCQFLMPVGKGNLPVSHGRGPQNQASKLPVVPA